MSLHMPWKYYWMTMACMIATRSKDNSVRAGSVIVNPESNVDMVSGYNGFPRGFPDDLENNIEYFEKPLKYNYTEHSERNAIFNAAREGIQLKGCTIFVNSTPCNDCARAIISSGIKHVVMLDDSPFIEHLIEEERTYWNSESKNLVFDFFDKCGVTYEMLDYYDENFKIPVPIYFKKLYFYLGVNECDQ